LEGRGKKQKERAVSWKKTLQVKLGTTHTSGDLRSDRQQIPKGSVEVVGEHNKDDPS